MLHNSISFVISLYQGYKHTFILFHSRKNPKFLNFGICMKIEWYFASVALYQYYKCTFILFHSHRSQVPQLWNLHEDCSIFCLCLQKPEQLIACHHKTTLKWLRPIYVFNILVFSHSWEVEYRTSYVCIHSKSLIALLQGKVKDVELKGHTDSVDQLCWDPKHAELIATASGDKTVRLWDARSKFILFCTSNKLPKYCMK